MGRTDWFSLADLSLTQFHPIFVQSCSLAPGVEDGLIHEPRYQHGYMLRSIGARDLMEEVALIDGTALMEEAASATEQVHISQMGLVSASDVAS